MYTDILQAFYGVYINSDAVAYERMENKQPTQLILTFGFLRDLQMFHS